MHLDAALSPNLSDDDGYAAMLELLRGSETPQPRTQFAEALQTRIRARSAPARSSRMPLLRDLVVLPEIRRGAVSRWLALAATVLLLLFTVAGAYIGLIRGDDSRNGGAAIISMSSPVASPYGGTDPVPIATIAPSENSSEDYCEGVPSYVPCRLNTIVGEGQIVPQIVHESLRNGRQVSLFRWSIEPGGSDPTSFDTEDHNGLAVDFVERGAYRATFSEPVVVYRGDTSVIPVYQTFYDLIPGETVELSRGDTVVYPLGSRTSLENPFAYMNSNLYGATLVLSEHADVSVPTNSAVTSLGTNQMQRSLNDYLKEPSRTGATFRLMFVQVPEDADLSADTNGGVLALGPLRPEPGMPQSAYVVWLVFASG